MSLTLIRCSRRLIVSRGMKIYTKTGDKGTTSLYTGERRPKTDLVFDALGATDELSASLGVAREYAYDRQMENVIAIVDDLQSRLQEVGSAIATPTSSASEMKLKRVNFDESEVKKLENLIDELDAQLPQLTTFILPGGGKCSAHLHMARTICRRAERMALPLADCEDLDRNVCRYLNRLSDLLFQLARSAQQQEGKTDQFKA